MYDSIGEPIMIDDAQRSVWQKGVFADPNSHAGAVKLGDYSVALPDPVRREYKGFPLSDREKQVLLMSSCGLTGREISCEINVSLSTVATYKRRILFKLGCRSMPEAVALATAYVFGAHVTPWDRFVQ